VHFAFLDLQWGFSSAVLCKSIVIKGEKKKKMGFSTDGEGSDGDYPPIAATIVDIGVDYRDYKDGNEENRVIIIWDPEGDKLGRQTSILSTSNLLEVEPKASVMRVGGPDNGFDLEIIGDVVTKGVLGYKASVVMNALKGLGVKLPDGTGALRELVGIKAMIKQKTYNETKGRERGSAEKEFWVPVELLGQPVSGEETPAAPEAAKTPERSLADAVLAVLAKKGEKELVEWFGGSVYYEGSDLPLFKALDGWIQSGAAKLVNGVYVRIEDEIPEDDLSEHAA
jgi:hypothetical protein